MNISSTVTSLVVWLLRAALVAGLIAVGWTVYLQLPQQSADELELASGQTALQIVLRPASNIDAKALDIPVEFYPIDIVSVRDEYFTERRAGKRFDDFLSERMKGRSPVTVKLDVRGHASIALNPGNWWLHALLSGDEELEWRLPVKVSGRKQIIELTSQNVYTRTRTF